ncbi:MAG: FAD-binding oxidoreductase [Chloroflexi bacterium]|nr:FAD-binding oxidoreductase [Chloroflexota bacterium]
MNETDITFLKSIVGEKAISTRGADLDAHASDESAHPPHRPEVVVWPQDVEQISEILRYANHRRIPVTARGGGSSLEGNPIPIFGGVVLAMYHWNKVLEIVPEDLRVRVQPGVVYQTLNEQLRPYSLFFPPAPGSAEVATIGGMVANGSSGMHSVKYGVTGDYVLRLQIVLPTGKIITVGSNAVKSASGYNLVRLFVGSEGTLGIITEITLRLRGLPEKIVAAVGRFATVRQVTNTVSEIIRYGLLPAAMELLDPVIIRTINSYLQMNLDEVPTLFLEFHGTAGGVAEETELAREICMDNGCVSFIRAEDPEERARLWKARSEAHNAVKFSNVNFRVEIGDIVVPISRYPEAVDHIYQLAQQHNVQIATFGHAGDGNLHVEILAQKGNIEERAQVDAFNAAMVRYAIQLGGTATGEHGVGIGKREFMPLEHGPSLELMRDIKRLIDPNGILNPGKIFPPLVNGEQIYQADIALPD